MESTKQRTPIPIIAGILAIISGAFNLLFLIGMTIAGCAKTVCPAYAGAMNYPHNVWIMAITLAVLGILAIVGGVFALQRRYFGWAVTGSVASILPFSLLGLASTILVALSHDEFE